MLDAVSPPRAFVLEPGYQGREVLALAHYCAMSKLPFRSLADGEALPDRHVPVGSVPWVERLLGRSMQPDYIPGFLGDRALRATWITNEWPRGEAFVKPADAYKRFPGAMAGQFKERPAPPYFCSDPLEISVEFRCYVANGVVLDAIGYSPDAWAGVQFSAPNVNFPAGWCGAVDFAILADERLAVIESHHPYSIGWYGAITDSARYAQFLAEGWDWMNGQIAKPLLS